ncbi:MAG: hypothetical protein COA78_32250 [Blastopirellula sp.]|nr:MAG: hypothetical protein COA78_32250 [Blastopirellula sp.]
MLQQIATYSLLFTYMAISLFGQTLHALSGCEHAHLHASHTQASDDHQADSDHQSHDADHHHHHDEPLAEQESTAATDGFSLIHAHLVLESPDCVLCQYLSQSQTIVSGHSVVHGSIAAQFFANAPEVIYLTSLFTVSSPRAPPLV